MNTNCFPKFGLFPIDELSEESTFDKETKEMKVHVRTIQRNVRKRITMIEGLIELVDKLREKNEKLTINAVLRTMKKRFSCLGNICKDKEGREMIKLSGDQRKNIKSLLVDEKKLIEADSLVLHGV